MKAALEKGEALPHIRPTVTSIFVPFYLCQNLIVPIVVHNLMHQLVCQQAERTSSITS